MQCESEGGILADTQSPEAYNFARHHIEANPQTAKIVFNLFGGFSIFSQWANGWWVGASKVADGNWRWLNGK